MDGQELDGRNIRVKVDSRANDGYVDTQGYSGQESYNSQEYSGGSTGYSNQGHRIYVGNLSWDTDEEGLREAFGGYGNITDLIVMCHKDTGRSRGFGYISFSSQEEMDAAIVGMDGQELDGRSLRVNTDSRGNTGGYNNSGGYNNTRNFTQGESNGGYNNQDYSGGSNEYGGQECRVFVGNLSWDTDEGSLREAFCGYGELTDLVVMVDRDTGRSRGFGYVSYNSKEEMDAAIAGMDGQMLDGRNIRVNEAYSRGGGRRGGGGGGYNSRSSGW